MIQTPATDSFLLKWLGDRLDVTLSLDKPRKGRAAFRTNLGNASVRRREIIDETERDTTPLAKAWNDVPMAEVRPGVFSASIPLDEVGIFSGKACFFPAGSDTPEWPAGANLHVKVGPALTRHANSIYTVFVRQFGAALRTNPRTPEVQTREAALDHLGYSVIPPSGTFRDVARHLPHIMGTLGFRIVQLLPIFPVPTTFARMGRFGSAFAATDFLSVDPACAEFDDHATPLDQFRELLDAVHAREGLVFVDLPANHTGWAATLQTHHPDWYHRAADGKFISPGAWGVTWADLVELDYTNPELRAYMADVFLYWCRQGVDGFRCDAGYMIPEATWTYIVARVREEYPDTVFMLEGLGGKVSVTESLLSRAGLDWAYSELFQTYDRGAFEWYLPKAIEMAERCGPLVHFAETHDNDRLAKKGPVYAAMRVALSALLSHQGAWGIANGVEWLATDKIDVHGASALNWDASANIVPLIARLNAILAAHPAFGPATCVSLVERGDGNFLAVKRALVDGSSPLLVLVNLDCEHSCAAHWDAAAFPAHAAFDLITDRRFEFDPAQGLSLAPGQVLCLSPHAESIQHSESDAHHVERRMHHAECIMQNVSWSFPADVHRDVVIPVGSKLLVTAPYPFRVRIQLGDRTLAVARSASAQPALSLATSHEPPATSHSPAHHALLAPPAYLGDGTRADAYTLAIIVYPPADAAGHQPPAIRRASRILVLPAGEDARVRLSASAHEILHDPTLATVLSNGAGADSQVRLAWGEISSRYDSLLSANPNPRVPADRLLLWTRCRAWLQFQGYSHEVNKDCLFRFRADPAGRFATWFFHIPCGMGHQVAFAFHLALEEGANATRLSVRRYPAGPLDVKDPVRIVFRPDVEWRSFHEITKAYAGPEKTFPPAVHATAAGFEFAPYPGHAFSLSAEGGAFHPEGQWSYMVGHAEDAERGQDAAGDLYSPGWFSCDFAPGALAVLRGSLDGAHGSAVPPPVAHAARLAESKDELLSVPKALAESLDLFVVRRDALKTVIAGYPWFLDWGRDTLIFLRGLIAAGRTAESLVILEAFARFEKDGTIPNIIHGEDTANRDTSDAPLWLVAAAEDLCAKCGKKKLLATDCGGRPLAEVLVSIVSHYEKGTPNGIHADPASGLVWSPSHFTWMDTNFPAGTPRAGYPVGIQALWIHALRFVAREIDPAWSALADRASASLAKLFALPSGGLADCLRAPHGEPADEAVVEDAVRPNQLFCVALDALPPGSDALACSILDACACLVVPGGTRSCADRDTVCDMGVRDRGRLLNNPHHPYVGRYTGDEDTSRKPAYHNGTVWGWTFPVYAEAMVRLDAASRPAALSLLASSVENLNTGCLCHISEIADGDAPHAQKGCRAQAWSESELLRVWLELAKKRG